MSKLWHHLGMAGLAASLMLGTPALAVAAAAGTTASVSVTAGSLRATIPSAGFGMNTAVWDTNLQHAGLPALVANAGITALRYPGGSTSDTYNWQTNSIVPGLGGYANPSNGFDAFMGLATQAGATPIITVNYGSNAAGNGGGTPDLAAAWVKYANVTKGYGVKYWEIGNEVYGNGEYGGAWETDLHSAHDPATYGSNVALFAAAMKAVDPTIKVGAVLAAPGSWPDGQSPDWNSNVLSKCGNVIDFVIVHWYPQNPGTETDAGLLAAPQSGIKGSLGIAAMTAKLKTLITQYGGANAKTMQVLVTETNSVSSNPGKQTLSVVNAMFVADDVLSWLENGVTSVDVWGLYNGASNGNTSSSLYGSATYGDYGILSSGGGGEPAADTPFPTYYGLQMVRALGRPGDSLVAAASSNPLLTAHAVRQANGNLALLLVNKDPSNSTAATVNLAGYTPAPAGTVYSYGETSGAVAITKVSGLGSTFTYSVPPYSLTTIVLAPAVTTPSFSLAATPGQVTMVPGSSSTAAIAVAPAGGFAGSVGFSVSGLPSGVTAAFQPATSTMGTTLTLSAGTAATVGGRNLTITGTSGALHASTTLPLTIAQRPTPNFSLTATPATVSLLTGGTTATAITVDPTGGFTGPVSLTASGLPAGVTASFSPASTATSSTLTLAASPAASLGSGTVVVTGASGALSQTVSVPLSVTAAAGGTGPATFVGRASSNSPWFTEDDVALTTTAAITNLTLTVTVPATNASYGGIYNTVGGQVTNSGTTSGGTIAYTFTLGGGQTIWPGSYVFAAQMDGNGTQHLVSGDTWTVTYTAGGVTYQASGAI